MFAENRFQFQGTEIIEAELDGFAVAQKRRRADNADFVAGIKFHVL